MDSLLFPRLWRFYRTSTESFPEVYQVLAGTALMPHPGHCPGDEQHRKVAGLTTRQCPLCCWPRKDLLARVAADDVGIKAG